MPVSTAMNGAYGIDGCALSVPAIIGRYGVESLVPISMTTAEREELVASANVLKKNMEGISWE
jgi:L-lactate dehydrogenase